MNNLYSIEKSRNNLKGSIGEEIAKNYVIKEKKYKILEVNYKNKIGEIDIIALNDKTTIFIEVKLSNNFFFGNPLERINSIKQQKIKQVATLYLITKNLLETSVRFDVIGIVGKEITYIENAF